MQKFFDFLRYGSAHFSYIVSSFVLLSVTTKICDSIISILSFVIFSIILTSLAVPKKHNLNTSRSFSGITSGLFTIIAILVGTSLETGFVLRVFRASSDNATTLAGAFVFASVICIIAFLCSIFGSSAVLKASNIIFIIPLIAFLVSLFGFSKSGISFEALRYTDYSGIVKDLFSGIAAAILTVSDAFIISFMQKKENCYNYRISRASFVISVGFILAFTLVYKMMFGNEISSMLYVPLISAVGIISGFDLEEVFLFVYSISLLFRASCRICAVKDLLKKVKISGKKLQLTTLALFLAFSLLGAGASIAEKILIWSYLTTLVLFAFAFVIVPILKSIYKVSHKK